MLLCLLSLTQFKENGHAVHSLLDALHGRDLELDRLDLRVDLRESRLELVAHFLIALLQALDRSGQLHIDSLGFALEFCDCS